MRFFQKYILLCAAFFISIQLSLAQEVETEQEFQTWTSFTLQKKLGKGLSLDIKPQLRFENTEIDKGLFDAGLQYKWNNFIKTKAIYRFGLENKTETNEISHRFALDLKGEREWNRWEGSLRLRMSTITDFEEEDNDGLNLRYRAKMAYNLPKTSLKPYISAELFQDLEAQQFSKVRYSTGASYKLFKHNYIGFRYSLDYYLLKYKNRHIISLNYKIKIK
ncbi:DUF2490 domain-containing protein [Sediminitomix flava]|uniref:Uncharacterized protein DUF2490 n=1 Tax=Sediminitomix flava TaxID=379075 RepID=A0A315ZHH8_SEDFL|nr:DUF2490 domain-containing protein [Sediminitomix flava]PWJ45065.1 uncharacterized protein DUF2490 [Sediminitomix flava]